MASTNSNAQPPTCIKRTSIVKTVESVPSPGFNAIHDFESARLASILKKTPERWRKKCLELLHQQAQLESQIRDVRSMLNAVMNAPYKSK